MDVKGTDGATVEWNILGGSVQQLSRLGIGKTGPNALKAGDEITVTIMPALDGKSPVGTAGGDHLPRRPHRAFPVAG